MFKMMTMIKHRVSSEKLSDQNMASDESPKRKHLTGNASKSTKVHEMSLKTNFIWCLSLITLAIVTVNVHLSNRLELIMDSSLRNVSNSIHDVEILNLKNIKPAVCMIASEEEWPFLIHIRKILERIGYEVIDDIDKDWDVLWAHSYPPNDLEVKPHQKVNHYPGNVFVTSKIRLSTSNLPFVPKSYVMPGDKDKFLDFASKHPNHYWLKKNHGHRGVKIQKIEDMNLTDSSYFIQEFIQNPFLIDGRKLDIGIYVIHTSIEPLRVYMFDEEAQFRFCAQDYYPFDPNNTKSYVIDDYYTPIWDIPSLRELFLTSNFTRKEAFNYYLETIKIDSGPMWKKMENMIATVYREQEKNLYDSTKTAEFSTSRHFFELTRFDFMIDDSLEPYLLESNMSPNLATPLLPLNQDMFEKVIFNTLSLSGIARIDGIYGWPKYHYSDGNFRVNNRDIVVNEDLCSSEECADSCKSEKCRTCFRCLSDSMKLHLKDAFLEQKSIWSAKRLLPSTSNDDLNTKTVNNLIQTEWFKAKCKSDSSWCSR